MGISFALAVVRRAGWRLVGRSETLILK